jgi:hypothetical protein
MTALAKFEDDLYRRREWAAAYRQIGEDLANRGLDGGYRVYRDADRIEAGELTPWAETGPETSLSATDSAEQPHAGTTAPPRATEVADGPEHWHVTACVHQQLTDTQRDDLFTAVTAAAHDWEPPGINVHVGGGPCHCATGPAPDATEAAVDAAERVIGYTLDGAKLWDPRRAAWLDPVRMVAAIAQALAASGLLADRDSNPVTGRWRVGRKVGRTIYGPTDELIGVMDTPALARAVVEAVNATDGPAAAGSSPGDGPGWDRHNIDRIVRQPRSGGLPPEYILAEEDGAQVRNLLIDRDRSAAQIKVLSLEFDRILKEREAARAELAERARERDILASHAEATDNALADARHQLEAARTVIRTNPQMRLSWVPVDQLDAYREQARRDGADDILAALFQELSPDDDPRDILATVDTWAAEVRAGTRTIPTTTEEPTGRWDCADLGHIWQHDGQCTMCPAHHPTQEPT